MTRRNLALLVSGNAVSALGNAVYLIAVTLLLKSLTESVFMLGLFQFMALAPGFILSPFVGAIIDRVPRRSVIVIADAARGMLMILAGIALFFPRFLSPWFLLTVSLLGGIGHAAFVPAVQAYLPSLVTQRDLHRATGLRAASSQLANLSGNAVGGVLFVMIGAPLLLIVNGLSFLISAVQEHFITPEGAPRRAAPRSALQDGWDGITAVVADRDVLVAIASQAGLFVLSPVLMLSLPFIVIDELGMRADAVGLFFALALAGGIVAFGLLRWTTAHRLLQRPFAGLAYLGFAAAFLGLSVSTGTAALVVVSLVTGAAGGVVYLYATTWIQIRTKSEMHGRFFSVMEASSSLAAPVSYLVSGWLLRRAGTEGRWVIFLIVGAVAGIWGVVTLRYHRGSASRS